MKYADIRDLIWNGSIVFLTPGTLLGKLIPMFTGGKVSHCGIAVWMFDSAGGYRLMMLESFEGGCRIVNLSSKTDRDITIYRTRLDWDKNECYALDKTGVVGYGYLDFINIFLRERLVRAGAKKLAKFVKDAPGEVCSQMVADVLTHSGQFDLQNSLMSPSALMDYVSALPDVDILTCERERK